MRARQRAARACAPRRQGVIVRAAFAAVTLLSMAMTCAGGPTLRRRPEWVAGIYSVGMARAETRFFLDVEIDLPEGADALEYRRVVATALCLERPQDLPIETHALPSPTFVERLGRVRDVLQQLATELTPNHRADPDWNGSFSRALRDELQQRVSVALEEEGVLAQIADKRPDRRTASCVADLAAYLENSSGGVVPADQQWKAMIDICPATGPEVRSRIVYHFTAEGVDDDRRAAILRLVDLHGFTECLARIIESDPQLTASVLNLPARPSYREVEAVRRRVAALWAAQGVPDAVEELRTNQSPGPALERLLHRCGSEQVKPQ